MMSLVSFLSFLSLITFSYQAYTRELLDSLPPVNYSLAAANRSDIKFYLYTSTNQTDWIELDTDNIQTLKSLNRVLPTKIFFHGFTTDTTSPWYNGLKREYFKKGAYNIIYSDWSIAGNLTYYQSSANIKPVGEFIASFLLEAGLKLDLVHLIGHSLGSHLTGFAGKYIYEKTGRKLGRITALDPGGPSFHRLPSTLRLCAVDAIFVDVHHTDIDYFGFIEPCGHVDFYPNWGKNQPGCKPKEEDDNCSHARSTRFYIESINKEVWAQKAIFNGEDDIRLDQNCSGANIVFGENTDWTARGVYYLKTRGTSPFLGV